jgi:hypothetical protein
MSPRDRAPYLEPTHVLPDGTELHAAHNLTSPQVDIIRRALLRQRSTLTEIIQETSRRPDSLVNHGLREEAHDMDELILNLYPNRTA